MKRENAKKEAHEPLFHIIRRSDISFTKALIIRVAAVVAALAICSVLVLALTGKSPVTFFSSLISGAFGTPRRIWQLVYSTAILLCISLAVTPAFRMKFWNIGAEGQVLAGGLACTMVMFYLGGKIALPLLWLLMAAAAIVASIIWALIPALFKAQWNTNETLFTLMMNYIAMQLVQFFINVWVKSGSGTLPPMTEYALPTLVDRSSTGGVSLLNILIVLVITALLYLYLRFSKHGYEISVVGESENTAKYIGINVKKVILRTLILSGALCGIAGLLIVGGTSYSINVNTVGGQGFTAIMVSWLAKFNPLTMMGTSLLIAFLEKGSTQVSTDFRINGSITDIVTAIILFFIIGCEFFINYKIVFRGSGKEVK